MSVSIYRYKDRWRASVVVGSLRKSKTGRLKAELKDWARVQEQIFKDILLDKAALERSRVVITTTEAMRLYADEVLAFKARPDRELLFVNYLRRELPHVDWPVKEYKTEYVNDWIDASMHRSVKPLAASTVLRYISVLGPFFKWCMGKNWITFNPVDLAKKPQRPPHRERRINDDEFNALLNASGYELGTVPQNKTHQAILIWLIALATGMRSGEIVDRTRADVMLERGCIVLKQHKTVSKAGARLVPLDKLAVRLWELALLIRPEHERALGDRIFTVSASSRDTLWRKVRAKAGLEHADLTFHDSRHEAASRLALRLKDPIVLCKVFGWKDPRHALVYFNPTVEELTGLLNQPNSPSIVPDFD